MILTKETLVYRVETEEEAVDAIEDAKRGQSAGNYIIKKSEYTLRQKKSKGEIVEQWFLVSLTKVYGEDKL